jgi:hypothetical protein
MNTNSHVTIVDCTDSLASRVQSAAVSEEIRQDLKSANVLLLPDETGLAPDVPLFPKGTEQFFQFLKNTKNTDIRADICIDDEGYKELALHADLVTLPSLITTLIAAPALSTLIAEYIKHRFGIKGNKSNMQLTMTIHDEHTDRAIKIHYDGPAAEYKFTMNAIMGKIKDNNINQQSDDQLLENLIRDNGNE